MTEIELGGNTPAIFKDPFNKKCVHNIVIWIRPKSTVSVYSADVDFINDNTLGTQKFNAESYEALMSKLQAFLNTLK